MSKARKSEGSRARRAIALLAVIAGCLIAVLIIFPRPKGRPPGRQPAEPTASQLHQSEQNQTDRVERPDSEATTIAAKRRQERPLPRARIAVVIDDVGYDLEDLGAFLDFPEPLTFSVLPNLPHSEESARRIFEAGKELLLHLPMEAENGNDPGPGAILTSQSDEQIHGLLEASFAQVPQAVGMNNHMGSRATADQRVMNLVMDYLKSSGRYFLDSRTTTRTLGPQTAELYAVPYLERDVFLDNEPYREEIQKSLENGVELAGKQGSAIMIGHLRNPQIVGVLGGLLVELKRAGVELVFLSELLEDS